MPASEAILLYLPEQTYKNYTHIPREVTDCERIVFSSIVAPCGQLELCSSVGYIEQGVRLQVLLLVNTK